MKVEFTIPGTFPGMNEIIAAANSNRHVYNKMKQEETDRVHREVLAAKVPHITKPFVITYTWIAKDKRRDPGNIAAAEKFIGDGLRDAKVIPNDTWKYVSGIVHRFEIDPHNPRVEICIDEIE